MWEHVGGDEMLRLKVGKRERDTEKVSGQSIKWTIPSLSSFHLPIHPTRVSQLEDVELGELSIIKQAL